MTIWSPSQSVKVKVLGLAWRGEELLVSEVEDSSRIVNGVRPLGGCVEFGETREKALIREFQEELGCAITVSGPWLAFENLFEHEGATGHEYLFVTNISLGDMALYEHDRFQYRETAEMVCWAAWMNPTRMPRGVDVYPLALLDQIIGGHIGPPN
jgi:hypothetical protein